MFSNIKRFVNNILFIDSLGRIIIKRINILQISFIINHNPYDHNIYTEEINKKSLCWRDDKRCIQQNSTDTLAWGHWRIESN